MKLKIYSLNNNKVKYLVNSDERLSKLIRHIKTCALQLEEDDFKCIIKYIIGQQISDKMRESIWNKLCERYNDITPQLILNISDDELRNFGICKQRVLYIKNLATAILNNQISFKKLRKRNNDEIKKELTKIKGIGNWTVEMYLIFSLGREDVFSKGDNTIKRVIKWMYNLENLPTNSELEMYFSKWLQYSTIVSVYFWEAIAQNLLTINFDELK